MIRKKAHAKVLFIIEIARKSRTGVMMTQQTEQKNQAQNHTVRTKNAMKCYKKLEKFNLN